MEIKYCQLIRYIEGKGIRVISGLVTHYFATAFFEGVKKHCRKYYEYEITFEEIRKKQEPVTFTLELKSNSRLDIDIGQLVTIRYCYHKETDGEITKWLVSCSSSKFRCYQTELDRLGIPEPDFFSEV